MRPPSATASTPLPPLAEFAVQCFFSVFRIICHIIYKCLFSSILHPENEAPHVEAVFLGLGGDGDARSDKAARRPRGLKFRVEALEGGAIPTDRAGQCDFGEPGPSDTARAQRRSVVQAVYDRPRLKFLWAKFRKI
jgi:hypothetical protein